MKKDSISTVKKVYNNIGQEKVCRKTINDIASSSLDDVVVRTIFL